MYKLRPLSGHNRKNPCFSSLRPFKVALAFYTYNIFIFLIDRPCYELFKNGLRFFYISIFNRVIPIFPSPPLISIWLQKQAIFRKERMQDGA